MIMQKARTTRLRTAIVGCGKVGATHVLSYKALPNSEFVSVCDVAPERAQGFAEKFQVKGYTDLAEMLHREKVEVLSVCTQHTQHPAAVEIAAAAGVHVISEKPLAVDLASCDRAIAAARAAGIKLGVISQRRWYEPVQRMKDAIDAGKLGKPVLAIVTMLGWREPSYYLSDPWRGTWSGEGGGVVVSQAPHYLDLLSWFMGPAVELHAYWDNYNHPGIEVDDTVIASIRFKNGGMGSVVLSNSQRPGLFGKIHVHGSSGASVGAETDSGSPFISGVTEKMDPPFNDIWTVPGEERNLEAWNSEDRSRPCNVMTHYHQIQLADFLDAVSENREPLVNAEAGRRVVELFTAVYRSQLENASVKLPLSQ
ncbi:MAG: Gfo/Idh/MocA family oxidoreductase [Terriglobales bacterium]|jgi:UDP-N-acetyl-2-amino-2-deoxyglucuronate dehydrogenase